MSENFEPNQQPSQPQQPQAEILRDDFTAKDSTVVVDEPTRTVLLNENETIVIEKEPVITIAPKNRPRKINLGMFGKTEYAVVAMGLLAILATLLFYMFVVLPAQKQLSDKKAERDTLEKELTSTQDKFKGFTTTEEQVTKLVDSVQEFETAHLPVAEYGRTALYQRLNTLIAGYGLVNTTGPDYSPLEINARQGQTEAERGRAKYQSLFPGVYVSMTVEGSYQNLRRFLRDIENSQQFMIVSAVEIEPSEKQEQSGGSGGTTTISQPQPQQPTMQQPMVSNPNQKYPNFNPNGAVNNPSMNNQIGAGRTTTTTITTQQNRPQAPRGKTIGETVSLHIEIAAYFKRNLAPMSSVAPQY